MNVRLRVTKLEDTETKRVTQFELIDTRTTKTVYKTTSTEKRMGLRQWTSASLFRARRRVDAWARKHCANIE